MSESIKIVKLQSWSDFRDYALNDRHIDGSIYRGQSNPTWPLASTFERKILNLTPARDEKSIKEFDEKYRYIYPYGVGIKGLNIQPRKNAWADNFYQKTREGILRYFKRFSCGLQGINLSNLNDDFQWWIIGRHHGLITPLLDWTFSPYIAAFCAFQDVIKNKFTFGKPFTFNSEEMVAIWKMNPSVEKKLKEKDRSDFQIRSNILLDELPQIKAQQSVFTMLNNDQIYEIEGYFIFNDICDYLEKILVPQQEVSKAMKDLMLMNICNHTLFPDIYGAAKEANLRHWCGYIYMGI